KGERSTYGLQLMRKDDRLINVKVSGSPRFKDSEFIGTMGVFTDITEQKIAEENLKKARDYTQNLIDTSMDMIVSVDLKRRILEFNPAAEKAFGYKKEEIFGKHVNLLYADENEGRKVYKTTVSEGSHVTEIWNKRKNGEFFPSLLEASVLKDSKGKPMGVMGVSRDISKEKAAEDALRESEERYRELINIAPLGIAIHQDGKWVMVNKFAIKLLGYENEGEMLGQSALDMIHPDYREIFTERVKEMIRTGKPVAAAEQKVLKKDGSVLDALATSAPIIFQGRPAYEVAVMNITELRLAQEAARESEEKFRSVIEQSNDGIYILQEDRFVFNNPRFAKLTGYKTDEISRDGFSFKSLFTEKGWAVIQERDVMRNRGEKLPGRYTFEGVRKNGRKRHWEVSVAEIDWEGKKASLGILQDVTERLKARDKLEAALEKARDAEKVKTLFLTNMSHEIRTPLNSIMGFTELIEQAFKKKSGLEELEFFENVQESSKRLMHTVHEVLDMSQIESETLPVNLKKYDLGILLEKAVKPLFPEAKAKGLELNISTVTNAFILADENCVVQSIVNLVDNAIKYTEKGRIDIELKEKGDSLELKIKDTGIGIGQEYIKNIFQVFTQESTGYTKKYQGVGLGLALVKNYLELCDAGITVKSKKGAGSIFTITFKKMDERRIKKRIEKPVKATAKIKPGVSEDKPQILIVEDDQSSQRLISFFLRDYYDLKFAASVLEAKEKLRAERIELVLLDLSLLGNEDGLDLSRYMRKSKKWQETPIIATTAHAFTEDRDKCLKAGCNDYIAKPIIREKLIEKMKQQLESAK
ncbi:MAG: PAS domain S-box protein, partial [Candidatus Neomarinimicrobiota bacterium]